MDKIEKDNFICYYKVVVFDKMYFEGVLFKEFVMGEIVDRFEVFIIIKGII